jgi:hypothetical protein
LQQNSHDKVPKLERLLRNSSSDRPYYGCLLLQESASAVCLSKHDTLPTIWASRGYKTNIKLVLNENLGFANLHLFPLSLFTGSTINQCFHSLVPSHYYLSKLWHPHFHFLADNRNRTHRITVISCCENQCPPLQTRYFTHILGKARV